MIATVTAIVIGVGMADRVSSQAEAWRRTGIPQSLHPLESTTFVQGLGFYFLHRERVQAKSGVRISVGQVFSCRRSSTSALCMELGLSISRACTCSCGRRSAHSARIQARSAFLCRRWDWHLSLHGHWVTKLVESCLPAQLLETSRTFWDLLGLFRAKSRLLP